MLLPQADLLVMMEDGRITEMGSYKELLSKRVNFAELLLNFGVGKENKEATLTSSEQIKFIDANFSNFVRFEPFT